MPILQYADSPLSCRDLIEQWKRTPIPAPKTHLVYPEAQECGEELADITDTDRFVYSAFYRNMGLKNGLTRCYVRKSIAAMLESAKALLPPEYSILMYDSLRPVSVQKDLYDLYSQQLRAAHPDLPEKELLNLIDDFVAFPRIDHKRPTPHSTGGAIDLTLMIDGKEADMGTGFDDLTDKAHTNYFEQLLLAKGSLTPSEQTALENRRILFHLLIAVGFVNFRIEWWHYSYGDRAWSAQTGNTPLYGYIEPREFQ